MSEELRELSERLQFLMPERGRGKRFSPEAKSVCLEAVAAGGRRGIGLDEVARQLGVSVGSLRRWSDGEGVGKPDDREGGLHEVVLREVSPSVSQGLVIKTPDGLQVSGVEVTELSAVIRALRT